MYVQLNILFSALSNPLNPLPGSANSELSPIVIHSVIGCGAQSAK